MLKKVIIENFFAFKGKHEINVHSGMNLLLGINGSGKTSFLNALTLLYEGVSGMGFNRLFQEQWGGIGQVMNFNGEEAQFIRLTYVFDAEAIRIKYPKSPFLTDAYYTINIHPLGTTNYTLREKLYTSDHNAPNKRFYYIDFKNGVGYITTKEDGKITYEKNELSGQELVLRQVVDPARFFPSYTIKQAIDDISMYSGFNTTLNSALRKPCEYSNAKKLLRSAENLPQLLSDWKNDNIKLYNQIDDALKKVNGNYLSMSFKHFGSQLYLSIVEKELGKTIGALHISDGTLRFLIYMAMLHNPQRGVILGIDEPETGLHPDMIKTMADCMKIASKETQLFVATHSPLLVNHFELDDLLIFEKNEQNDAIVKELKEEQFEEWLDNNYLPGQLWVNGVIGGKRW